MPTNDFPSLQPTQLERELRNTVIATILSHIKKDETIRLPDFDPELSRPADFALLTVGLEPNDFCGTVESYRYQFEGEEDLLHLIVTEAKGHELSAEQGQSVAGFLLAGVSSALIWLRPGTFSQHFYVGHEELLNHLIVTI